MVAVCVGRAPVKWLWAFQRPRRAASRAPSPSGDYHLRMTQGARSTELAVAANDAPASLVFGAQSSNARGAVSVQALALAPVSLAHGMPGAQASKARGTVNVQALAFAGVSSAHASRQLYAMRGPLSGQQSRRNLRCGVPAWLALARAASANKSMHTDAQVLSAASRPRLMGAGDFRR